MAATAIIQARIDPETKKEAAAVLDEIGLTLSDAVRLLMKRVSADKQLPFELRTPNAKTVAAIEEPDDKSPVFNSIEELMGDLHASD